MGRRIHLTGERRREALRAVLKSVSHGASVASACGAAGVSRSWLYRQAKRCPKLRDALERASDRATASVENMLWIKATKDRDVKAALTWLRGHRPAMYHRAPLGQGATDAPPIGRHYLEIDSDTINVQALPVPARGPDGSPWPD